MKKQKREEFEILTQNDVNGDIKSNIFVYLAIEELLEWRLVSRGWKFIIERKTPVKVDFFKKKDNEQIFKIFNFGILNLYSLLQLEYFFNNFSNYTLLKEFYLSSAITNWGGFALRNLKEKKLKFIGLNFDRITNYNWFEYLLSGNNILREVYLLKVQIVHFDLFSIFRNIIINKEFDLIYLEDFKFPSYEIFKKLKTYKLKIEVNLEEKVDLLKNIIENTNIKLLVFEDMNFLDIQIMYIIDNLKDQTLVVNDATIEITTGIDENNFYISLAKRIAERVLTNKNITFTLKNDKNVSFNKLFN